MLGLSPGLMIGACRFDVGMAKVGGVSRIFNDMIKVTSRCLLNGDFDLYSNYPVCFSMIEKGSAVRKDFAAFKVSRVMHAHTRGARMSLGLLLLGISSAIRRIGISMARIVRGSRTNKRASGPRVSIPVRSRVGMSSIRAPPSNGNNVGKSISS